MAQGDASLPLLVSLRIDEQLGNTATHLRLLPARLPHVRPRPVEPCELCGELTCGCVI